MDRLAEHFVNFVDTPWTPFLLALHAFLESSFLPGAHDFFIVAVTVIKPNLWAFFATFSTIGSTCGGCFGYALGRFGGRPLIEKLTHKKIVEKVEASYQKYGLWAVAFAGFTPVPYKIFAICSGIFEIHLPSFIIVSFFARAARFFLISALIFFIGAHIKDYLIGYFNVFSIIILGLVALIVLFIGILKKKWSHET